MITITNRQRTVEFDVGYGAMRAYRCAIAKAFGVGDEYIRSTAWGVTPEESSYWVNFIEKQAPSSLCKFLFACDCKASFSVKQCDELYCLLKSAKLPNDFNPVITMYGKTLNLHEAFIKSFDVGRHKGVGVKWW